MSEATAQPLPSAPTAPPAVGPQMPAGVSVANPWARLGSFFLDGLLMIVTLGIGWIIWAATIAGNGQTPAKRLMNLRVVSAANLRPATFGTMFLMRGIVAEFVAFLAIPLTLGILLFMPFWDRRKQNLWDKVSSTYVVTDPNDAWQTRPDLRAT